MPADNWMPWVNNHEDKERQEFIYGALGRKVDKKNILYALIAGYVGGKIAKRMDNK